MMKMKKGCSIVLVLSLMVGILPGLISAQGMWREKIEAAPAEEVEAFLSSGDPKKIYRALIVNEAARPLSAIKPLWLFLTEAEETAFRVNDRTRKRYHMVDVLPWVRKALADYGAAATKLIDEALESEIVRKRVEGCRLAGRLTEGHERYFNTLVKASEDNHGFVRIAALRALPVHGRDAINPLFRRLRRCSDWQHGGKFSFEEIDAICSSFDELTPFAPEIRPRLTAFLDRDRAPDVIVKRIAATVERLSR